MIFMDIKKRLYTSLALLSIVFLTVKFNFFLLYILIVFGTFSLIEFFNIIKIISKNKFLKLIQNLLFIIFIFSFCFLFFFFSNTYQLKIIIFILLFGCISSDIGGLIIGNIFKGPKLTKLSPKKTISGAFGSIFFSIIIVNILFFYFIGILSFNIIAVSILVSLGCQTGDLFFSFLKRKAKIKDTGNILPGHGGVLDRLDGIFLGLPIGFVSLILLF
jgi:phosphatidate cytidylyltransferase